ncbi:zinc ABC transporter substrate-binding protein [bacterium]|nr:zinc ABC transporter substrate-binding protein [bacterium]
MIAKSCFNLTAILISIAFICLSARRSSAKNLNVVASIFPLQEFAKAVGGKKVKVDMLLPPGAEPHTWEPRPSDIVTITKADIFIYIGAGMEPWIKDVLEGAKHDSLTIVEASDWIDLIEEKGLSLSNHDHHHPKGADPHIWLDFYNDQIIIDKIAEAFCLRDPDDTNLYMQNAADYKNKLSDLDKRYIQGLEGCKGAYMIFGGHSAFSYLTKRYGLHQVTLYGISPDSEPSPKKLAEVVDLTKKLGIKTVFFEKMVNDRLARVIAEETGAATLALNPGPNLSKEEREAGTSFISIMDENLKNLRKGLGCE